MRITFQEETDMDTDSTQLVRNQLYIHMKKMHSISMRYHMVISLLQPIVSTNKSYTHLFVSSWVYIQKKLCNYAMCKK